MNLVPFDQFELRRPDGPEALCRRLAGTVDPHSLGAILKNNNKLFYRQTRKTGFKIWPVTRFRYLGHPPIITGRYEETPRGTVIHVKQRLHSVIMFSIFFGLVGLLTLVFWWFAEKTNKTLSDIFKVR